MLVAKQGFSNKVEGSFGASIKSTFKSPEEWHQVGRAAATEHIKSLQRSSVCLLPIKTGEPVTVNTSQVQIFYLALIGLGAFSQGACLNPVILIGSWDGGSGPLGSHQAPSAAACFRGTTYLGSGRLAMTCVPQTRH